MYTVERDEDTKCFQQKYIYPGLEQWESLEQHISSFIHKRQYMYNGGWAIHYFLKSLNIGLQIYDEGDICDSTDFDMFGPSPGEDLIALGNFLKTHLVDMTFTVNNGMHPNQYTIMVNFVGAKLVDWIYISPKVYKSVPSVTYKTDKGQYITCLHPRVELLRQYNMLSNIFLMAPDKDISKALKRIALLEKYALVPWIKDEKLWDGRSKKNKDVEYREYPIVGARKDDKNTMVTLQEHIMSSWFNDQKYVCVVGHFAVLELLNQKSTQSTFYGLEFVVHDAVFSKCVNALIVFLKDACRAQSIPFHRIDISVHEAFIGVIGPLYNGWIDVKFNNISICKLYSLATPVHIEDNEKKLCSYFFNMSHLMWRALYLRYLKHSIEAAFYDVLVARTYKTYLRKSRDTLYIVKLKKENTIGVTPARNFYMMNNMMRMQGMGMKYVIDNKEKDSKKPKTIDFKYNDYEGKVLARVSLDKAHGSKLPQLPYLYGRIVASTKQMSTEQKLK
jgi:hypothetical protein